nr:DUF222 domain-containing protein [uncultured Corynebacterium sp.]
MDVITGGWGRLDTEARERAYSGVERARKKLTIVDTEYLNARVLDDYVATHKIPRVIAEEQHVSRAEGRRRAVAHERLGCGELPVGSHADKKHMPKVREKVEQGVIGADAVEKIDRAIKQMPLSIQDELARKADPHIAELVEKIRVDDLDQLGPMLRALFGIDDPYTDEDRKRKRSIRVGKQGHDGMSKISGQLTPHLAAIFKRLAADHGGPGDLLDDPKVDSRDADQRLHDAVEAALAAGFGKGVNPNGKDGWGPDGGVDPDFGATVDTQERDFGAEDLYREAEKADAAYEDSLAAEAAAEAEEEAGVDAEADWDSDAGMERTVESDDDTDPAGGTAEENRRGPHDPGDSPDPPDLRGTGGPDGPREPDDPPDEGDRRVGDRGRRRKRKRLAPARGTTTVVAVTTLAELLTLNGTAMTDTGVTMSVEDAVERTEARHLFLQVLDFDGRSLYLGRSNRLGNVNQYLALLGEEGMSSAPMSSAPPAYCHMHHMENWARGGLSDIENLTFVDPVTHANTDDSRTNPNKWWSRPGKGPWEPRVVWTPPVSVDPKRRPGENQHPAAWGNPGRTLRRNTRNFLREHGRHGEHGGVDGLGENHGPDDRFGPDDGYGLDDRFGLDDGCGPDHEYRDDGRPGKII